MYKHFQFNIKRKSILKNYLIPITFIILTACSTTSYQFASSEADSPHYFMKRDVKYIKEHSYLLEKMEFALYARSEFGQINFDNSTDTERLEFLTSLNSKLRRKFTYRDDPDGGKIDIWQSGLPALLEYGDFKGDCEDLAFTGLELAHLSGFPKNRLYKIGTNTKQAGIITQHMLAGYMDDNGDMWIFGDTITHKPLKINNITRLHSPFIYSRMDWNGAWEPPAKLIHK